MPALMWTGKDTCGLIAVGLLGWLAYSYLWGS